MASYEITLISEDVEDTQVFDLICFAKYSKSKERQGDNKS